jgi:predicted O-methyltransferase YrrM
MIPTSWQPSTVAVTIVPIAAQLKSVTGIMMTPAHSTLWLPEIQAVLERLHSLADDGDEALGERVRNDPAWRTADSQQKAAMLREALLPVSRDAGRFLYAVARSISAKRVVEFGTSFGVSTIYFAAALRDNGGGVVIGSELETVKVAKAKGHLAEAGLSEYADIRPGDAIQTLADTGGTIDVLFLDGWKELYLDVLQLALPSLRPGSVVLADDISLFPDQLAPYLDYVRNRDHGFVSVALPVGDGIEYSFKL